MLHRWGTSRVSAKQLQRKDGSGYATLLTHPALDHSSVTPVALELLTELAARLPFEEAALIATKFGLSISKSQLERLIQPITSACRELTNETLRNASPLPFVCSAAARKPRLMVLEVDGVRVLGKPSEGVCDGIEIKNVTIYPQSSPSERLVVADIRDAEAFREAIKGLIALAGVTAQDILVGVGDGALWVEAILDEVCDTSITDCFHAAGYLEVVMVALGFAQPRRAMFRRAFCKGQIDVGAFLMEHLPPPEVWLLWDEEARVALRYLGNPYCRRGKPKRSLTSQPRS